MEKDAQAGEQIRVCCRWVACLTNTKICRKTQFGYFGHIVCRGPDCLDKTPMLGYLIGPFYVGPNLSQALFTPGKKFGLPPLWDKVCSIKKCRILKNDKEIIFTLLWIFYLFTLLIINQKNFRTSVEVCVHIVLEWRTLLMLFVKPPVWYNCLKVCFRKPR